MTVNDLPGEKYNASDAAISGYRGDHDAFPAPEQLDPPSETGKTMTRKLRVKLDLAIVPMVSIMYMFCFIDRGNIGNAKIAGIEASLNLQGYDFNIALTCFAVAYAVCQIPASICCKLIGPGWLLPGCTIAFGIGSISTGLVHNRSQLFAVRSIVGMCESAMFPGIAYYMSRWYCRAELGFRLSFFVATAPLAGAFGGLLASGILRLSSFGGFHGWRMIFAIEGIITIGLGVLGFFFISDGPETARWLTPQEREIVTSRLLSERVATTKLLDKMDRVKIRRGLTNPVTLGTGALFLFNASTVQGLAFFLPTIVATIYPDASIVQQQLYTVPPYAVGVVLTLGLSGISWWLDKRNIILIIASLPVIVAYILFISTLNPIIRYAAAFLVASTSFVAGSMTTAQVSGNVDSDAARAVAIGVNTMFASLGAIFATWSFLPFDGPHYRIGNGLNLATSSTWLLIGIGLSIWMYADNKRRESMKAEEILGRLGHKDRTDLDWKHPNFRWRP